MASGKAPTPPRLIVAILGCEAAGAVAGLATRDAVATWYPTLQKPQYTPPGAVFAPVWTTLYALMGIALALVSQPEPTDRGAIRLAQALFAIQLTLNVAWSFLFFNRRSPGAALVEIGFLWLAILLTALAFARVSRPAALLLAPYLAWVSFAAALNHGIWRLNR